MPQRPARILVVEDDDPIRQALELAFKAETYAVEAQSDGSSVRALAERFQPDLAVLDIRLPTGPDGYQMARILRDHNSSVAVMMLTAADRLEDRLEGFDAGADDYVIKPFMMAELLARARALLRRSGALGSEVVTFDDIVMDDAARRVTRGAEVIDLTRIEYELLSVLLRHPRQVLSKRQLLTQVWDFESFEQNRVEVHMSALRRKLEEKGPRIVQTVRGVGYVLRS